MEPKKIIWVDFAKGYAIFTIVCYHVLQRVALPPALSQAIVFGGTGVHLFFMLSGFGLGLSRSVLSPLMFYRRRLSKIWLPYIVVLTLSLLGALTLGLFPNGWPEWLAGVGLYQMFHEPYIQSFGGHFWFISTIIQFYIVFPVLIRVQRKINNPALFAGLALLISIAWWLVVWILDKGGLRIWNSFFLQFLWEFALGMALAQWSTSAEKSALVSRAFRVLSIRNPLFWSVMGSAFSGLMLVMILKMGDIGKIFNDIPALAGYTGLCIFIWRVGQNWVPPLKNFFLWVSGFSFSLYLVHVLVLELYLLVTTGSVHSALTPLAAGVYLPLALLAGRAFEPLNKKISQG